MDIFNDFISRQCVKLAVLRNMVLSSKIFEQANSGPFCKLTLYIYRSYGFLILNYLYNQIHFDGITCSVYFIGECEIKKPSFLLSWNKCVSCFLQGILFVLNFIPKRRLVRHSTKNEVFHGKLHFLCSKTNFLNISLQQIFLFLQSRKFFLSANRCFLPSYFSKIWNDNRFGHSATLDLILDR